MGFFTSGGVQVLAGVEDVSKGSVSPILKSEETAMTERLSVLAGSLFLGNGLFLLQLGTDGHSLFL